MLVARSKTFLLLTIPLEIDTYHAAHELEEFLDIVTRLIQEQHKTTEQVTEAP
jgi:hypothetical protein